MHPHPSNTCYVLGVAPESASTRLHKKDAPTTVPCAILVISTSVADGTKTDSSGAAIREMLEAAGHRVAATETVSDDAGRIRDAVLCLTSGESRCLIATGGTGLVERDVTFETVRPLFSKEITGFLPLFMALSYPEAGAACMLSRATAGLIGRSVAFFLPGSPNGVRLAMEKIIVPEIRHIVKHLRD